MNTFEIEHVNEFIENGRIKGYSENTVMIYGKAVRDLFQWLMVHQVSTLKNITLKHLRAYQNELNGRYSINTVVIKIRTVKQFFRFLVDNNYILINPAQGLVLPIADKTLPVNILSQSEMKHLLDAPDTNTLVGIRNKAVLELLYSTAVRRQECLNLQVRDVDLEEGILRVNEGKGSKDRLLPLGETACVCIHRYLMDVRAVKINADKDHGSLFINIFNGKPLSKEALQRVLNDYGHKLLNKPVSVHTIRRSCATHMIQTGASPKFVQKLLGHSNSDTLRHYVKLVANDVKQAHHDYHPRERAIDD